MTGPLIYFEMSPDHLTPLISTNQSPLQQPFSIRIKLVLREIEHLPHLRDLNPFTI